MAPIPVSHPSDVEERELRAISKDLVTQAAFIGYASGRFHGFRVAAIRQIREVGTDACARVDLHVEHDGATDHFFEGTVNASCKRADGGVP